jgi:hypothetical protein
MTFFAENDIDFFSVFYDCLTTAPTWVPKDQMKLLISINYKYRYNAIILNKYLLISQIPTHVKQVMESSNKPKIFLIHIISGGEASNGSEFLPFAVAKLRQEHNFVFRSILMNPKNIKERNWSPTDAINWLLEADFHVIATHMHQGHETWSIRDLMEQIPRLEGHPGFANGCHLKCPSFLQDKIEYLYAIPEFVNPTLKVSWVFYVHLAYSI